MNRALIAGVAVAGLAAAFSAGRFSAPRKVETRDVEHVVFKDKIVEVVKTVEVKAKAETKVVYRDRVTTKDGTVTEREVERTDTKEDTKRDTDSRRDEDRYKITERIIARTVTLQPDWRVHLLAGVTMQDPALRLTGPLVLGVQVDRRIAGGMSFGVWGNTFGAAGVALSLEF